MIKKISTFKKYWWVIPVLALSIIGSVLAFRLLKRKKTSDDDASQDIMKNLGVSASRMPHLNKAASELAHHLGTKYGWWNPRNWSENDEKAYMVLKSLSQPDFDVVKRLYNEVYAKGRTLLTDIVASLDEKYYKKLTHLS